MARWSKHSSLARLNASNIEPCRVLFVSVRHGFLLAIALLMTGCNEPAKTVKIDNDPVPVSTLLGKPAPTFVLVNHAGHAVTLDDYKGKWTIVYFYPRNDTPNCVCRATDYTKLLVGFGDLKNVEVLAVSPDSPELLRRLRQKYGLKVTLLSDADREAMRAFGAWDGMNFKSKHIGRVVRSTVLLDPTGVVRYHWPKIVPEGHVARVASKLRQFQ